MDWLLHLLGSIYSVIEVPIFWILSVFFRKYKTCSRLNRYKRWAIITGCTDGIGKAFCFELASYGFNLILLSRNTEKLTSLQSTLKKDFPTNQFLFQRIDFANFSSKDQKELIALLKSSAVCNEIGVLINNVGASRAYPGKYLTQRESDRDSMLSVNVAAMKKMIDIVLPIMLKNEVSSKDGRKGAIVNISSLLSLVPPAKFCLYQATKAFVDKFTEGLHYEYKKKGIDFQVQFPGFVATNMTKLKPIPLLVCSPENYAARGVNCIGCGLYEVPHPIHKPLYFLIKLFPYSFISLFVRLQFRVINRMLNYDRVL